MPKTQWTNLPPAVREHLFDRLAERQITAEDLYRLKVWRESEPYAPDGLCTGPLIVFGCLAHGWLPRPITTKVVRASIHPRRGPMPFIDTSSLDVIERLPGWRGRYFHSPSMTFAHYDFVRGSSIHEHYEQHKGWESVFSYKDGGNYAPALAASASTTAIFCSKSSGKPCRSCKYTGLLYESQACP